MEAERHGQVNPEATGLFAGLFDTGGIRIGDEAWLRAVLDTEAALARALERAGLVPEGAGAAVTTAAMASRFDPAEQEHQRGAGAWHAEWEPRSRSKPHWTRRDTWAQPPRSRTRP
jgi:adenylosuccinate lyase